MITLDQTSIEEYGAAAHDAGWSREQYKQLYNAGYWSLPSMLAFHKSARDADRADGPDRIALGGTRGPGKTFAVFSQVALDDCQRIPGLKWLFLRKYMKVAAESFDDLVSKVLRHVSYEYTPSLGKVEFPNGSKILIGGYRDDSDIDKYLGIEYDGMVVEEATQITELRVKKLEGSLRSSVPGWRTRMYFTTNPDGIGIAWFKKTFIDPFKAGVEKWTRFFQCHWKDNIFLSKEYIHYLEGLDGQLGKAWRDGDWDAFEGMAFPAWRADTHVINPFPIPAIWPKWAAVDYGTSAPFAALWFASDPTNGRVYVYREAYGTGLTAYEQAELIKTMTPTGEQMTAHYADPAMWAKDAVRGEMLSLADQYQEKGIILVKADNNRFQGKGKIDTALGLMEDGKPRLQVFRTCLNLIRTIPELPLDKTVTWDVDTKAEDHAYDALRYGLTNVRRQEEPKKIDATKFPMLGIKWI
jgi:phage terminase large subunit